MQRKGKKIRITVTFRGECRLGNAIADVLGGGHKTLTILNAIIAETYFKYLQDSSSLILLKLCSYHTI